MQTRDFCMVINPYMNIQDLAKVCWYRSFKVLVYRL